MNRVETCFSCEMNAWNCIIFFSIRACHPCKLCDMSRFCTLPLDSEHNTSSTASSIPSLNMHFPSKTHVTASRSPCLQRRHDFFPSFRLSPCSCDFRTILKTALTSLTTLIDKPSRLSPAVASRTTDTEFGFWFAPIQLSFILIPTHVLQHGFHTAVGTMSLWLYCSIMCRLFLFCVFSITHCATFVWDTSASEYEQRLHLICDMAWVIQDANGTCCNKHQLETPRLAACFSSTAKQSVNFLWKKN